MRNILKKVKDQWSTFKSRCKYSRLSTRGFRLSTSSGFTLVETLVAITILMIAIAGPLTVAEKSLSASIYARDQLMASYLAQDGMEYMRNIVDNNELNIGANSSLDIGDYWIKSGGIDLETGCTSSGLCMIDTINNKITQSSCTLLNINTTACPPLDLSSNGYTQDGINPVTTFTRYFYVQPFTATSSGGNIGGNGNAANVTVTVIWPGDVTGGGGVTLEDTMYDAPMQ
jgi:Tfp pilus assembly protein PilV